MRDTSAPAVLQAMSEFIMQIGQLQDCKSSFLSYSTTQKMIFETWDSILDSQNFGETSLQLWESILLSFENQESSREI